MSLFTGVNIFGVKKGRSPYDQSLAVSTTQSTNASASSSSDRLPIDESYVPSVQPPVIPNYPHFLPSYEDSVAFPVVSVKKYARTSKRDEVKLAETSTERKRLEEQADLYSIIRTTESVEAAYSRDAITESEYTEVCNRLLSQFKTTESALLASGAIKSIEHFMHLYSIDCPRALHRLVVVGVPATVQHSAHDDRGESVLVAETVHHNDTFTLQCRHDYIYAFI
jgi:ESCRT-I complex subunit VPS28